MRHLILFIASAFISTFFFSFELKAQEYDYSPTGYVSGYSGDHNIEFKLTSFDDDSDARTKFVVRKKDGTAFGSSVTVKIRIDSDNGSTVTSISVSSGSYSATSGYYSFGNDVTNSTGRKYYATLSVGGFTHKAGPIRIWQSVPLRLATPVITQPNNGATIDLPVTIKWNSVSNATTYRVSISTSQSGFNPDPSGNSPFQSEVYNTTVSGTSVQVSSTYLQNNTTYYVSVRAGSNTIMHSLFCNPVKFVTSNPRLGTPVITQPNNGSTVNLPVTIKWNSVSNATTYRVSISTSQSGFNPDPSGNSPFQSEVYNTTVSGTSVQVSSTYLQNNTTYYVSVRAGSNTIMHSLFCSPISFTTNSPPTFNISGTIKDVNGNGLGGVTVSAAGITNPYITIGNGSYSFQVEQGYSGMVTPSKSGYNFEPQNRSYSNVNQYYSAQDFVGTVPPVYYTISGYVKENGVGMSGVTVAFSGNGSVITNSSGFYTKELLSGFSGTVTPSKSGYTFTPANRSYTNLGADYVNQDFVGKDIPQYKLPFPANLTMYITDSYGQGTHTNTNNDYYCVDFNLIGNSDYGIPVLACRDGIVKSAGWSVYGYRVELDHGDGIVSNYSHGTYITVFVGEIVKQGQELMMIWNSTPNPNGFMPHLHYGLRKWESSQNKYVSMELPNHSDYTQFSPVLSSGYMSDNQYYVPGKMIEESDSPAIGNYLGESNVGHAQRYKYAKCVGDNPTVVSRWIPDFSSQKNVEIFVCIPGNNATTTKALYKIYHLNGMSAIPINQYSYNQPSQRWISLGTYTFSPGNSHYVELGNSVSDFNSAIPKYIGFDAVYFRDINEGGGYNPVVSLRINSFDLFSSQTVANSYINVKSKVQNNGAVDATVIRQKFSFTEVGNRANIIQSGDTSISVLIPSGQESSFDYDIKTPSFGQYDLIYAVITNQGDSISWAQPIFVEATTSIDDSTVEQEEHKLFQNYPNPFNPTTNIIYEVKEESFVRLEVFNLLGQVVSTLISEVQSPGRYSVNFDASKLADGTYFYRIQAGDFNSTQKMILLK